MGAPIVASAPMPEEEEDSLRDVYYQSQPYDAHISRPPPLPATVSHHQHVRAATFPTSTTYPGAMAAAPVAASSLRPPADRGVVSSPSSTSSASVVAARASPHSLLPVGAVPINGGVWFTSDLFAHSYRVPGPGGEEFIYYDNSIPMPPVRAYPTLVEQWHMLTITLKIFLLLFLGFLLTQTMIHWHIGVCLFILLLPTAVLYRQWTRHYDSVELYLLVKLYAIGFAPGAICVMIVETILTIAFMVVCFQGYIASLVGGSGGVTTDNGDGSSSGDAPSGLEFLNYPESASLYIFLFLLSYGSAGLVEESLKYFCANRVKKYRPAYRDLRGVALYAVAASLGFSTIENIGYVLAGALGKGGDSSLGAVALNAVGRTFVSTPLHLLTGYLIGLQVVRRDLLGESLRLWHVLGWSVFFHGTFDFGLFVIMSLQRHWTSGDEQEDNIVSFVLMACVVINCYAGLVYRIWRSRQIVFASSSAAGDQGPTLPASNDAGAESDADLESQLPSDEHEAGVAILHAQNTGINADGFARLHTAPEDASDD